ncbi:10782_t:CDS:2, partial [Entrophospora sp. SA101]
MNTASKIRKPQTNNFTSILDQILKKYNLSTESNPSQLHVYASELGAMLPDWKAHKRNEKLTIKERAQYCAKSGDPYDIWLHALDLIKTKNDSDEEIVASSSRLTLFRKELKEAGVDSKVIDIYAKFSALTQDSNEIQKRQLVQRLPNAPKTPKHFSLEEGLRRIQSIDTTKIPTMQDLADVIMMLSMRPAEVTTLRIIHCEEAKLRVSNSPDEPDPPKWYKPERAKELLTWIQDAIATRKLRYPVYSDNGKRNIRAFSKFLNPY